MFKINMGSIDRIIRFLLAVGAVLAIEYFNLTGAATYLLGIVAVVFLATSVFGHCPLYSLMGFNTCPRKNAVE